MKQRIILHCDANSFYASVECARNPELKGKPLAVSGNPENRTGIILAKNDIAKPYGVKTGEAIWQAKEKCPDLICVFPNHNLYEEYSEKLHDIYATYTPLVEPFGIDECWLDITETAHLFGGAESVAEEIRERVKKELGITVSIGISFSKLFAKLGSDIKKPDAITKIPYENFKELTYLLPISSIIGIGRKMEQHLKKMNVFTLGDLAQMPVEILKFNFGVVGEELSNKVKGLDQTPVKSIYEKSPPKSVGNGTTTIVDIVSRSEIKDTVLYLSEQIGTRLRKQSLTSSCISVTIKTALFEYEHHSKKVIFSNDANVIANYAMELIDSFWEYKEKIRSIRICCSNLTEDSTKQLSLFDISNKKQTALSTALDTLRGKYGKEILTLATLKDKAFLRE